MTWREYVIDAACLLGMFATAYLIWVALPA